MLYFSVAVVVVIFCAVSRCLIALLLGVKSAGKRYKLIFL